MGKKNSKRSEAVQAARSVLIALSAEAKKIKNQMIAKAKTLEEALLAETTTINSIVLSFYQDDTGCTTFKTFLQWKELGYSVKKGESAFRVWGTPREASNTVKMKHIESGEEKDVEQKYEYWPMCCLFNESQVEKKDPDSPDFEKDENKTHSLIKDLKNENNSCEPVCETNDIPETVDSPFVCGDYEERIENKKDRLLERASKAEKQSNETYQRARDMASVIPFGQPILVGHHSEKRDRNYRDKINNTYGKAFKLSDKADYLNGKAETVGTGGIASDDPEALKKLTEQLTSAQQAQEKMKAANRAIRAGNDEQLKALGFNQTQIEQLKTPDFCGRIGYADYELANNNANIRRLKKRIDDLKNLYGSEPIDFVCDHFKIFVEDGRIHFEFDGKPERPVLECMGKSSWNWSRYTETWKRKATCSALHDAECLKAQLLEIME